MENITIGGALQSAASQWPEAVAVETAERKWTFRQLSEDARRAARAYLARGMRKGDVVGIWAPNCAEWIIAAVGIQLIGGVIVPLNSRFKGTEAAYILNRSRARMLVTVSGFLGTDYPALIGDQDIPTLEETLLLPGFGNDDSAWESFLAAGDSIDEATLDEAISLVSPDDISDILFTSGTTGHPKGVLSAHNSSVRMAWQWARTVGLGEGDRYLVINPFFHSFGYKAGWVACISVGATVLPEAVFDANSILHRIERDKITAIPGPPAIFQSMLTDPDFRKVDLSSLRLSVTGAASVPPVLIERMRNELGFKTVLTAYGLTEAPVVTVSPPNDTAELIATTCGVPIKGVEVKIIDDDGQALPVGEAGEVLIRGFNVMRGYLDDPEATAEAIDADGWLHTGDVGTLDEDGRLRITDRKKEMFITGGFNCYPAEIERLMAANEAIAQVAVIGVPDERMGEVGRAYVIRRPGSEATEEDIISWCRQTMANYKVPRSIRFVDALPMTASGKVQRFQLHELG